MLDPVRNIALDAASLETESGAVGAHEPATTQAGEPVSLVTAELLVEDVSIDGMCGVY
jgi:mycofactocin precursor